jgi:formate-dependent phosphoribosylglycinamide formyltransferase (GAR transformylase)
MHILDCRAEWQKPPVLDTTDNDENVEMEQRAGMVAVAVDRSVQAHARRIMNTAVVVVITTMRAYWIHLQPLRRRRLLSSNA